MKSILQRMTKSQTDPQDASDKSMEKAFDSLPREGGAFRVLRRGDRGQLKMLDVLPRDSVLNPDELLSSLQERWGGGRYYVLPTNNGKKAGEGFAVEFDAEPKKTRKNAEDKSGEKRARKPTETDKEVAELREELRELKEKDREDRLLDRVREEIQKAVGTRNGSGEVVDSILKNLPQVVTGVSGLFGNRESAADMLEKISTIWKNVESSMPQTDPIQQAKEMAELIFTIVNQSNSRAPVSTTGPASGGGLTSFLASIIAELEKKYLGGMAAMSATGAPPPALAPAGAGFAGRPETSPEQTGSFPNAVTEQQTATEQPPEIDQSQTILPGFDMRSLGIDPETRLRELLASRHDPEETAVIIVYLLDFLGQFAVPESQIAIYIESFFTYPAAMFDQVAPLVAELRGASAEYLSDLRDAIIKEVGEYTRQRAEEAAARSVAEAAPDEGEKNTLTPEQRQAQEEQSREREAADEKVDDEEPNVEDREAESEAREGAQQS